MFSSYWFLLFDFLTMSVLHMAEMYAGLRIKMANNIHSSKTSLRGWYAVDMHSINLVRMLRLSNNAGIHDVLAKKSPAATTKLSNPCFPLSSRDMSSFLLQASLFGSSRLCNAIMWIFFCATIRRRYLAGEKILHKRNDSPEFVFLNQIA